MFTALNVSCSNGGNSRVLHQKRISPRSSAIVVFISTSNGCWYARGCLLEQSPRSQLRKCCELVSSSFLPADSSIKEARAGTSIASPRGRTSDVVIDNRKFSGFLFTLIVPLITAPKPLSNFIVLFNFAPRTHNRSRVWFMAKGSHRMAIYEQLFAHTGNMAESFVTVNLNVNLDARHC